MDYGNLLKRAWHIVWNNKFMFVLGFLAALGSGGNGGNGGARGNFNVSGSSSDFNLPPGFAENIERYWAQYAGITIALVCLAIILGIVFWLVSLVGQAGLISAASRIDSGEQVTLGDAFGAGTGVLVRMIGLNLILYGPFILLGLIFFGIASVTVGSAVASEFAGNPGNFETIFSSIGPFFACFGILACVMVPLGLIVTVIYPFAQRGLILQELGIVDSIRHGWNVLRDNIGDVFLLILLFVVIGFVFGIAAAVVLLPAAALAFLPTIVDLVRGGTLEIGNIAFMIGGGICLGLLGAVINSIMIAFRSTTVTLAYQEFINKTNKLKAA